MSAIHQLTAFSALAPLHRVPAPVEPTRPVALPVRSLGAPAEIDGFTSAEALLRALSLRQVSAAELIRLQLRRIQHYDVPLQAFARLTDDALSRVRRR